MVKIRVEYDQEKCVGQGNCAKKAPNYFELKGEKAILKNSQENNNVEIIEAECDDTTIKSLTEAGESCPVNAIRVTDMEKNEDLVAVEVKEESVKEVKAEYDDNKEFVLDDKGYFLIRISEDKKELEVGFCNEKNKLVLKVTGKKPIDIYQTILNKENLNIRKDHAAYLGRELQKAYVALTYNFDYVQDDELDLDKFINKNK